MDPETGSAEPSDTIVVAGDYTDESQDESYDSFDAYGEDEDGEEQSKNEPDAVNDDYAQTFDSPTGQNEAGETQPNVSEAAESMNSSSASDSMKNQSPSAPTSALLSTPPLGLPTALASAQPPSALSEQAASESHSAPQSGASTTASSPAAAPADLSSSNASSPSTAPAAPAAPASETLPDAPASAASSASESASENEDDAAVDIQKLVDSITARAAASAAPALPPVQATSVTSPSVSTTLNISPSASLPPKPSTSHQPPSHLPAIPQTHSYQPRNSNSLQSPVASQPPTHPASQRGLYLSSGTPGTANDGFSSLPPLPPTSFGGSHAQTHPSQANPHHIPQSPAIQQAWETFLADEKRYTSEAKWDRFPEGSRIFIGNLSSERVSKREVFEAFQKFGRLAQISLKNAYGFVQYHNAAEGMAAMQGAQGSEMGGRKIHLEISRAQKKKDKDERDRSPERRGPRGERGGPDRGGHANDRFGARNPPDWRRDDYRPGRSPSPRRNEVRGGRDGPGTRDRDFGAYERRRSRSPPRFGRGGPESYRARSPSPHRRAPSDGGLDLPRRHGSDVPDVQLLLLQEVPREFVSWVQRAFHDRGLKTDVMFLSPRFPRDAVVQRQILEGVHAIIDLDYAAQMQGKISIQVFSRLANASVLFEQYQNLDPPTAAELVIREKAKSAQNAPAPSYGPGGYGRPSYAPEAAPAAGYSYPYPHGSAPPAQVQPAAPAPDLASLLGGQLDNSALQALLASLQPSQAAPAYPGVPAGVPPAGAAPASHIDINALLGNLRNTAVGQTAPPAGYGAAANYGATPAYMSNGGAMVSPTNGVGFAGGDTAQQVQSIMEQLKRATQ
ncbi:hypothetical protein B0T16DRAFT_389485 [Cercophora newfieldiana]|uniref:RRM domain-containing protein n=1 Tax=Cercophora newfieldiana TaxID=92897 RepID=A0AA40CU77_9PEZI|nr:hypothetical protein B0T16DRAFT_389485 [Cercophora newfieldiana]